jgi:hypothetical protein
MWEVVCRYKLTHFGDGKFLSWFSKSLPFQGRVHLELKMRMIERSMFYWYDWKRELKMTPYYEAEPDLLLRYVLDWQPQHSAQSHNRSNNMLLRSCLQAKEKIVAGKNLATVYLKRMSTL